MNPQWVLPAWEGPGSPQAPVPYCPACRGDTCSECGKTLNRFRIAWGTGWQFCSATPCEEQYRERRHAELKGNQDG